MILDVSLAHAVLDESTKKSESRAARSRPGKTRKYKGLQRAAEKQSVTLQARAVMLAPAPLAQWIERWPPKPKVARSNRAGRATTVLWPFDAAGPHRFPAFSELLE